MQRNKIFLWLMTWVVSGLPFTSQAAVNTAPPTAIYFKGNLIEDACIIKPGDEVLKVGLRTRSDKDLYDNPRSTATPFQIHLEECDPGVASSVKITFTGTESTELDGYLAVSDAGVSKGFAIGIETTAGVQLKLNDTASVHELTLQTGSNIIDLQAFLQAEPTAITNQSITLGTYTATATFLLEYI